MASRKRRQPVPPQPSKSPIAAHICSHGHVSPLERLHMPLPTDFPVTCSKCPHRAHAGGPCTAEEDCACNLADTQRIPPAPYGDHGYVAALDRSGTCLSCGKEGWIERHPGRFPRCGNCGVKLLYMGKFYDAPCISGNGRTDCHGSYVKNSGIIKNGMHLSACAFCGRDLDELLPEWPEIEEDDITVETGLDAHFSPPRSWVRITHKYHPEISILEHSEVSLLKNKAIALKRVREALKRVGRGAYNLEE